MTKNLTFFFNYLKKEKINIDQNEFTFQVQSHPDYPSLLAVSDTLSFFKVSNLATRIEEEDLEHLPDNFVSLIKNEEPTPVLAFVERTKNGFLYTQNVKPISVSTEGFKEMFQNIVLLVENEENEVKSTSNKASKIFGLLSLIVVYLASVFVAGFALLPFLFICFVSVGVYLSIEAISHEFGVKTKFSQAVCTVTTNTDCGAVINSKKSRILKIVSFSDASIAFFGSQLLALLFMAISNQMVTFYSITTILLLFSIPVTLFSIYQQVVVAKKWCPICLAIIAVIYAEISSLMALNTFGLSINTGAILYFALALMSSYLLVVFVKKTIKNNFELQSKVTENNRFKRKYSLFKMALLASDKVNSKSIVSESILLGNPDAKLKIIIVSSPFCGHCKEAHNIIQEILDRYGDKVCFDLHFNYDEIRGDEKSRGIHHKLVEIYFSDGQKMFMKALHDWFENKDESNLLLTTTKIEDFKISEILHQQFVWNKENNITFTPAIIINGYHFPKEYDRNDLIHFINDLEDDDNF